jgi:prophage maintenance system killer protein
MSKVAIFLEKIIISEILAYDSNAFKHDLDEAKARIANAPGPTWLRKNGYEIKYKTEHLVHSFESIAAYYCVVPEEVATEYYLRF